MNPSKLLITLFLALACGCAQPPETTQPAPSGTETATPTTTEQQPLVTAEDDAAIEACFRDKQATLRNVSQLLARHQPGCRVDADCVLVDTSISCQSNCKMAVYAPSARGFTQALESMGKAACEKASKHCTIEGVCPQMTGAACVSGMCQPVIAGLGAPSPVPNYPPQPGVMLPSGE